MSRVIIVVIVIILAHYERAIASMGQAPSNRWEVATQLGSLLSHRKQGSGSVASSTFEDVVVLLHYGQPRQELRRKDIKGDKHKRALEVPVTFMTVIGPQIVNVCKYLVRDLYFLKESGISHSGPLAWMKHEVDKDPLNIKSQAWQRGSQ